MPIKSSSLGGTPFGGTSDRPSSPSVGQTFYNGTLGILEVYNGTSWIPCSSPPGIPTYSASDASTSDAYTSTGGKINLSFTANVNGSSANGFTAYANPGAFSSTSSSSPVTITGLTPGTSYNVYGTAYNNFGSSANGITYLNIVPTTLPEVPIIGTATTSASNPNVVVTWTLGNNGGKSLTSITITPFLNGTTAQTPVNAATTSSTSHTFTNLTQGSSYTFKVKATNANGTSADSAATSSVTVPILRDIDFLVVAGGGAGGVGGSSESGGGGAGGLRSSITATGGGGSLETKLYVLPNTNYTVTVGAGGAAGVGNSSSGSNGNDSVFATVTSIGGGRGSGVTAAPTYWYEAGNGGSGGGAGYTGVRGQGTSGQGFIGGTGLAGGGGGAGEAGNTDGQGQGGDGVAVSITGSSVFYGGGGGAGNGAVGGDGGGGAGSSSSGGVNGTANTGGGGGGNSGSNTGRTGGSGIVILRYPNTVTLTASAGLTTGVLNQAVGGSERYTTFTAGTGTVSFS